MPFFKTPTNKNETSFYNIFSRFTGSTLNHIPRFIHTKNLVCGGSLTLGYFVSNQTNNSPIASLILGMQKRAKLFFLIFNVYI